MPKGVYERTEFHLKIIRESHKRNHIAWNKGLKLGIDKMCIVCKKKFYVIKSLIKKRKCCSITCSSKFRTGKQKALRVIIKCKQCNKKIKITEYKKQRKKFCCRGCYNKYLLGKTSPRKGTKNSILTRKKISDAVKGRYGKKSPAWKGGLTKLNKLIRNSVQYKKWSQSVYKRDDYTCQKCNKKKEISGKLEVADKEKRLWNIRGGITFCKECHEKFHSIYGRRNNTKKQLIVFLND